LLRILQAGLSDGHGAGLRKVLGVRDLVFMGIAAVIGAGIFLPLVRLLLMAARVSCSCS
jgi:L-asparagine transporter-like permease